MILNACDRPEEVGTSSLRVHLTDGPGPYDEVNIDIQGLEVHTDAQGWITIPLLQPGVYDLLKLTNGLDTLLGSVAVPSGKISQLRLILGGNNTVKVNGTTYDLKTPSGQQSGVKILVNENLIPGITYDYTLDFDASRSVVETGNGKYLLKPVIRAITTAENGILQGVLSPSMIAVVQAISSTGDTTGTYSDSTGGFQIPGLESGTYQVDILPPSPYSDTTFNGVVVVNGQITNMGTLTIQ
ncbi:MAG: DUF4382 domain-containing protein [Bacteroidota bacterium]|nr:DUF4382 domain-containing protein [Bacteroidota bacterium]MDX5430169.1 DUF4382 domain-containing protein [Bacteroidota bacterium]MDX5468934.1 DUF4382 domain-containing protein [Bacteroidota bacterium]